MLWNAENLSRDFPKALLFDSCLRSSAGKNQPIRLRANKNRDDLYLGIVGVFDHEMDCLVESDVDRCYVSQLRWRKWRWER